ncbi:3-hydroxybenzoate 6-monooxygenase [Krasilnikovia sp. M28-CT-15]|uniref:3-hydroxybenzoate 6-monooxygenase n=1 Tax=Krasilnikovia sp. M28-CT-15 TaxID=3373540 RepID=UPI0038774B0C
MARIIIAGGGIGGLAAALTLSRRGHQAVVLEARDSFTELGAGIQLGPNAFAAMDRIGVGDQVRERAVFIDELRFMDGTTDKQIASMPLTGEFRRRFGNPYAVVHRIDLYAPLLEACRASDAIELRTEAAVDGYEQTEDGVTVRLASGDSVTGAALVGADGINSRVRQQVVGDGLPRISGHTIYRSVIPMAQVPERLRWNTVTLWAGPRWHFVHYPIAGGEYFNLAATRDDGATEAVIGEPVDKAYVLEQFPAVGATARQLLDLGENWKSWVLCDRDPVPNWADGRVVLLGDAAHPMLQYAAQGACQALEDAVVLGDLVPADGTDFSESFQKFTAERRDRTRAIQLLARRMGRQLYHPAGRMAEQRNARFAARTARQLHDTVDWLYAPDRL